MLTPGDREWLQDVALPFFGMEEVRVAEDLNHRSDYPDVWADLGTVAITVTRAWARESEDERRKRLTHELLHLAGMGHGKAEREMGYYSRPERDSYSLLVYQTYLRGDR